MNEETILPEVADDSSRTITGLGSKGPEGKRALASMREQMLGESVVDETKTANVEANRMAKIGERTDMKKQSGTVTYGKGTPHARS